MGLSIHYQGQIKDYSFVEDLVKEIEDICINLNWSYKIYAPKTTGNHPYISDTDYFNYTLDDVAGISIIPEGCEPVELVFFPSGRLCSTTKLRFNDPLKNDLMVEWISTKTQYAGIDTHISIIKLLRYLQINTLVFLI